MFVRGCISDLRGATFQMHGPSGADPGLDAGDMKIVYNVALVLWFVVALVCLLALRGC